MAGEGRTAGPIGALATVIGAITAGARSKDKLIRTVVASGLAGVLCIMLLRDWKEDRIADRLQRQQQHAELVMLMREQHGEDIAERRIMACVNQQMTTTVRAAIWREKPQPLEACAQRSP